MDKIKVQIGSYIHYSNGVSDTLRPVEFEGEELARLSTPHDGRGNRGRVETLYRVDDDRLVVYIKDWSHWQGEGTTYTLVEVTEEDLGMGGEFEFLGREAGMGRPLTLDEALE